LSSDRTGAGTLAEVLDICAATITPALIDPAGLATLRGICAQLPAPFAAFWGLECGLGDPRPEADLLVEIKQGSLRHQLLAGAAPSILDQLCATPAWSAVRAFAREWADSDDGRHALVRNLWLEFDLRAAARATPPIDALERPSVFWGPSLAGRGDWSRFRDFLDYARNGFPPFPWPLPLDALERAVTGLPGEAQVFQVGAMQARGDVVLRMCVNRIEGRDVPGWLTAQGWRGDAPALAALLARLTPLMSRFAIDVDFTASGIGPTVGIECYRQWRELDAAQWVPLLDFVAGEGLCTPAKRDALVRYPAKTDFSLREQFDQVADGQMHPMVYRNLHHLKLAYVGEAVREAKAYLGVTRPGIKLGFPVGRGIPDGDADEWLAT
jgi:hypothetical protein